MMIVPQSVLAMAIAAGLSSKWMVSPLPNVAKMRHPVAHGKSGAAKIKRAAAKNKRRK